MTHLAVGPRHGSGRLVPADLIESVEHELKLGCTTVEFDGLRPDRDRELLSDAARAYARQQADVVTLGYYDEIAPGGIGRQMIGAPRVPQTRTFDRVPAGQEELQPDEDVLAIDGPVGRVRGLDVQPATHQIVNVLIESGHLWGKREIAVPIDAIERIGMNVHVALTKRQIGELSLT